MLAVFYGAQFAPDFTESCPGHTMVKLQSILWTVFVVAAALAGCATTKPGSNTTPTHSNSESVPHQQRLDPLATAGFKDPFGAAIWLTGRIRKADDHVLSALRLAPHLFHAGRDDDAMALLGGRTKSAPGLGWSTKQLVLQVDGTSHCGAVARLLRDPKLRHLLNPEGHRVQACFRTADAATAERIEDWLWGRWQPPHNETPADPNIEQLVRFYGLRGQREKALGLLRPLLTPKADTPMQWAGVAASAGLVDVAKAALPAAVALKGPAGRTLVANVAKKDNELWWTIATLRRVGDQRLAKALIAMALDAARDTSNAAKFRVRLYLLALPPAVDLLVFDETQLRLDLATATRLSRNTKRLRLTGLPSRIGMLNDRLGKPIDIAHAFAPGGWAHLMASEIHPWNGHTLNPTVNAVARAKRVLDAIPDCERAQETAVTFVQWAVTDTPTGRRVLAGLSAKCKTLGKRAVIALGKRLRTADRPLLLAAFGLFPQAYRLEGLNPAEQVNAVTRLAALWDVMGRPTTAELTASLKAFDERFQQQSR